MVKAPRGKEIISKPTNRELTDAARRLPQGSSAAGRVMADKSVYNREHPKKGK